MIRCILSAVNTHYECSQALAQNNSAAGLKSQDLLILRTSDKAAGVLAACRPGGTYPDGGLVHDVGPVLVHMLHLAAVRLEARHAPLPCYCNHQRLHATPDLTRSQH